MPADFNEQVQEKVDAQPDVKVKVDPNTDGFREQVAADTAGEKPVDVPVGPNAAGFRERVAAATAGEKPVEVPVRPDIDVAAFAAAAAAADAMLREVRDMSADLMTQTALLSGMAAGWEGIRRDVADTSADLMMQTGLLRDIRDVLVEDGAAANYYSVQIREATASAAGAAAGAAGFRLLGTGIRLTATSVHWLISGFAELAAVVVPATVAAGAWAAVWMQGAGNVYEHITAVYTATESLANAGAQTAGQMLGLGHALQTAQNQANPDVYSALGGAINVVKESAGGLAQTGLQVGKIFDQFMGKLVYDFSAAGQAGKTFSGLLTGMVPDLTMLGQVLGNIAAAVGSFAAQMPGLAEVLLRALSGITGLVKGAVELAGRFQVAGVSVLTLALGLEEFNRWGSLGVSLLGKLGLATTELSGATGSYFLVGDRFIGILKNMMGILPMALTGVGNAVSAIGKKLPVFSDGITAAGDAMSGVGKDAAVAVGGLTALQTVAISVGVAGLVFLAYKFITAKSAAQQFTDALVKTTDAAGALSVYSVAAASMTKLSQATTTSVATAKTYNTALFSMKGASAGASGAIHLQAGTMQENNSKMLAAEAATSTYSAGILTLGHSVERVTSNAQMLASFYHISIPAAMSLAQRAGVSLTDTLKTQSGAWTAVGQQIRNTVKGYGAMGTSSGQVGTAMLAVAIQSGEAATKMSTVNSAMDAFMQGVTSGTNDLAGFQISLGHMGNTAADASGNLAKSTLKMSASVQQFATSLHSYTGKGAADWQQFDQVVGSTAPQMIDWWRTAESEGALSTTAFGKGVEGMIAQLIPFASKSKVAQAAVMALAQDGGITAKTFGDLKDMIDKTNPSLANEAKATDVASIAMGNMAKIAENLGNVMGQQVTSAIAAASLKASGFTTDINNLAKAQASGGDVAGHSAVYWANQAATAYQSAGKNAQISTGKIAQYGNASLAAGGKNQTAGSKAHTAGGQFTDEGVAAIGAAGHIHAAGDAAATAGDQMQTAAGKVRFLSEQLMNLHGKTISINVLLNESGGVPASGTGINLPPQIRGHATGGVIPGYAPGHDSVRAMLSPGEGVLVPEAVRAIGGSPAVSAINRKFGGSRVSRGNKTGHYASGGITESATFAYPQDIFNIGVTVPGGGGGSGGGGGHGWTIGGGGDTAFFNATRAQERGMLADLKLFASGTLTTVASIKTAATTAVQEITKYFSGNDKNQLIGAIKQQALAMEALARQAASIAAKMAAEKAYAANITSNLQGSFGLGAITAPTNAKGNNIPITGSYITAQLKQQLATLKDFFGALGNLKKMGLDKAWIAQVVALGPQAGLQYARAIIAGGHNLIDQINSLENKIGGEETAIGRRAAEIQYGQSISKGFLSGLKKDEAALKKEMDKLGDEIAHELAKALGVPLKDIPGLAKSGGGGHHGHGIARGGSSGPAPSHGHHPHGKDIHVHLEGSKGKLSHEEMAAISHEIGRQLSLAG